MGIAAIATIVVGVLLFSLAFWKVTAGIRETDQILRELAKTALYPLPHGKGTIDLDAITLIVHDHDGLNTRVWLDLAEDEETPPGCVRPVPWPVLVLPWAQGIELEQAWKARAAEKNRRLSKD